MRTIVTILVLVETPLQYCSEYALVTTIRGHNPCFSGNSFAIAGKIAYFTLKNCLEACDFQCQCGNLKINITYIKVITHHIKTFLIIYQIKN